ncbi:hypothetical protein HJFPF1_12462 [Paramyrothecium foliicola]|nr:hypothetical protein HJFPF1_12462 [Paramyrothecium foliicola]
MDEKEAGLETEATEASAGPFSGGCVSWGAVDTLTYGNVGIDDFEFEIDQSCKAIGLQSRVMRETLKKVD